VARLSYSAICSLDGFVADEHGNFDWAAPDEEVHQFVNDQERGVGTYLLGRRMYEVMQYWETARTAPDANPITLDFARIWRAAEKIVYSRTLETVATARTRLEKRFDGDAVRRLKAQARADGNSALPADVRLRLELLDERRFASGVIYLRYRVA